MRRLPSGSRVICRDLAYTRLSRRVKPGSIAGVGRGIAVQEQPNRAGRIHVPDLAAVVRADQESSGGQEADRPDLVQPRRGGGEPIAAAAGAAIARDDGLGAVGLYSINTVGASVGDRQATPGSMVMLPSWE